MKAIIHKKNLNLFSLASALTAQDDGFVFFVVNLVVTITPFSALNRPT